MILKSALFKFFLGPTLYQTINNVVVSRYTAKQVFITEINMLIYMVSLLKEEQPNGR